MIQLRDYQLRCVREVSAYYKAGVNSVLLQKPTGSGKTRTASYIVDVYAKSGRQVLWLVHREELLMQAAMTFAEYGIEHRMVCATSSERAIKIQQFREMGRSFISHNANVVIASIQTIVRRLDSIDWLNPAQIVADECHLSLAVTWRKVLARWQHARLLGLTATPCRLDKQNFARSMGGLYEQIVLGPRPADLIAAGHLAKYRLFAPPVHLQHVDRIGIKGGDFDTKDLEKELSSAVVYGDVVSHYRKYSHGKPAIAFCPTVETAQRFAEAFNAAGYRAISLDGQTDDAIRRRSLQQLGSGDLDVVTSVSILVEGTDVPYATTAILLRRTQSLSLYLQAVGRVLRPHPQKEHAIILDCVGVSALHGFPDDDRDWSLEGGAMRKKAANDNDGPDVMTRTCKHCFAIFRPAPVCPACGHPVEMQQRREMKQVDAELNEVDIEAERRQRMQARREQGKAQTAEDMMRNLGYSRGRAEAIVKARDEKAALQEQAKSALADWHARHQLPVKNVFGIFSADIGTMKPKALKELIERIAADDEQRSGGGFSIAAVA